MKVNSNDSIKTIKNESKEKNYKNISALEKIKLCNKFKENSSKNLCYLRRFFGFMKKKEEWCTILGGISLVDLSNYENGIINIPHHIILFLYSNGINLNWFYSGKNDIFLTDACPSGILKDEELENFLNSMNLNISCIEKKLKNNS